MDKKTELRLAGMLDNSLTNGVGIRKVYFSQGCKHHCKGCFSPHTWDFVSGKIFKVEELFEKLVEEKDYLNGVTFSGGDPLEQAEGFANFAKKIKTLKLNIWCWTGYVFEDLIKNNDKHVMELLRNIDVLVDGRFDINKKTDKCRYRGSSNQRLIDVKKSLIANKTVLFELN